MLRRSFLAADWPLTCTSPSVCGRSAFSRCKLKKHLKRQAGYATAEFALVIPAFILVIALVLGVFAAGAAKVQTCAQARIAARAVSLGEPLVQQAGIATSVQESGTWITATAQTSLGGSNRWVPQIKCVVKALREPDYATIY